MPASGKNIPSRAEGLRRLDMFLPEAGISYALHRNTDRGPAGQNAVSMLSPYLRYRLLTEAEIVEAVLQHHGPEAAGRFVQEVAWRTYWKGWLELRPVIWARFQDERDAMRGADVARAETGATGIECFDTWARDLVAQGYLHNHARLWFASIWIFTLRLPWALGADFFLRFLRDADPASNTLSWRWVAGLQTPGKTYLATAENIARFTEGRFHPRGLATEAEALREAPVPAPVQLPDLPDWGGEPAFLLVTREDFYPELLVRGPIRGAVVVRGTASWPWGDHAASFVADAALDAAARVGAAFDCTVSVAAVIEPETIVAAARRAGVRLVVTAYAPVGPVADAVAVLDLALDAAGLTLIRLRRDWDAHLWPHATKGYFAFRTKLPAVLYMMR